VTDIQPIEPSANGHMPTTSQDPGSTSALSSVPQIILGSHRELLLGIATQ
jgi:hypothetical protein